MRNYFLTNRFFIGLAVLVVLFCVSFRLEVLYLITVGLTIGFFGLTLFDGLFLSFPQVGFEGKRSVPERLSNGDQNDISIELRSLYKIGLSTIILEDLPHQLDLKNHQFKHRFGPQEHINLRYQISTTERGEYTFGNMYVIVFSALGLVRKRNVIQQDQKVACYPSFMQLRKYDFLAISNQLTNYGVKKIRRLEQNTDFAQIKEYVNGDNYKHINWKATARTGQFMVNQYQAERSQNIYCIIDKGRAMKMPFNGLTLLDYAINSALVMSSIAIRKDDKSGLVTFSRTPDRYIKASNRNHTISQIADALYEVTTNFHESDFGRLYKMCNAQMTTRSLLLLYSNFETMNALQRQMKYLRALARKHVVVVIFFENTEVTTLLQKPIEESADRYRHVMAESMVLEKQNMVKELAQYGIQSVVSKPENLTVDSINKYLELKSKGAI